MSCFLILFLVGIPHARDYNGEMSFYLESRYTKVDRDESSIASTLYTRCGARILQGIDAILVAVMLT